MLGWKREGNDLGRGILWKRKYFSKYWTVSVYIYRKATLDFWKKTSAVIIGSSPPTKKTSSTHGKGTVLQDITSHCRQSSARHYISPCENIIFKIVLNKREKYEMKVYTRIYARMSFFLQVCLIVTMFLRIKRALICQETLPLVTIFLPILQIPRGAIYTYKNNSWIKIPSCRKYL